MERESRASTIGQLHGDFQKNSLLATLRAALEKFQNRSGTASPFAKLTVIVIPLVIFGFYIHPVFDALAGVAAAYALCFLSYVLWYRLVFRKKYVICPHCGEPISTLECGGCGIPIPPMFFWLGGMFLRHCHNCKAPFRKNCARIHTRCADSGANVVEEPRMLFRKSTRIIVWVDIDLPQRTVMEERGWKYIRQSDDRSLFYRKAEHGSSSRFPCLFYAIKASHVYKTDVSGNATNQIDIDDLIVKNTRLLVVSSRVARKYAGLEGKVYGFFNPRVTAIEYP